MGIALGLIVLMVLTAILSMTTVVQVGDRLQDLAQHYIPIYGNLARANIRSLERALMLRRIVIDESKSMENEDRVGAIRAMFEAKGAEVEREVLAARTSISELIEKGPGTDDTIALTRLDSQLESAIDDSRRYLNQEIDRLLPLLKGGESKLLVDSMARVDALRDDFDKRLDSVRAAMLSILRANADAAVRKQHGAMVITAVLTGLAAVLGVAISILVSTGMARPIRQLLEGTRAVETGHLDQTLVVTSRDEIGSLTTAFNHMIEQLRHKERIREAFGKYIDPRIVEGLIEKPVLVADGQRRVMTVMFCDVKGFTGISEGMTPQGLVKVMNRYFSTMSAPIHKHGGIIDKYIGDAIMAYWGPPFTSDADQARLASLAALDMLECLAPLQAEIPELLGMRSIPMSFDIRIGIATGEVLVGSIGSERMMSYTVIGDAVNVASRLEGANKVYGGHILVSEATAKGVAADIETREIDRVIVLGQTQPQSVFELMAPKGGLSASQIELQRRFADGLSAYRARRWDEARPAFAAALRAVPADGPSMTLLKRISSLAERPPADDWDGSWPLNQK